MKIRQLTCILAAAAVMGTLAGCKTEHEHRSAQLSDGRMLDDKEINESVKANLRDNPVYKFNDVTVGTFAGVVQLSGFASTQEEKREAEQIAQRVAGVQRVDNAISIKPGPTEPTGRKDEKRVYSQ